MRPADFLAVILDQFGALGYRPARSAFEDEASATTRDHSFRVAPGTAQKIAAMGRCVEETRTFVVAACFDVPPTSGDLARLRELLIEEDRLADAFLARPEVTGISAEWAPVAGVSAVVLTLGITVVLNRLRPAEAA